MYLTIDNRRFAACLIALGVSSSVFAQQPVKGAAAPKQAQTPTAAPTAAPAHADAKDAKDASKAAGAPAGDAKNGRKSGGGDGQKGEGGRGGGGRTASVVLSATDVFKVVRTNVDAGVAIAGDLRPIESAIVRGRIDGVLEKVAVRDGQQVKAGTLLAKFESVEQEASLRSADADFIATKSDFETQKWNYEQSKELFKVGAIAERDFRTAQQAADAARARMAASESRQRIAQNVVRDTKVVAPFNGTIDKRKVQNGENTLRGAEMFTLVRDEVLELAGTVPARRASDVKVGQSVRFNADSRQFSGRVARVSATIDPATRSITVYVQIPNGKGELKGNSFANGQIVVRSVPSALVVPQSAVRQSAVDGKSFVYTVEGGQLGIAKVSTGILDEAKGLVEIVGGVKEGDVVITGNVGTLGVGMKVTLLGNEQKSERGGRGSGGGRGGRGNETGADAGARPKKSP